MLDNIDEVQIRINDNLSLLALRRDYGWTVEDHTAIPTSEIMISNDLIEKFITLLDFVTTVEFDLVTFTGTESDLLEVNIK